MAGCGRCTQHFVDLKPRLLKCAKCNFQSHGPCAYPPVDEAAVRVTWTCEDCRANELDPGHAECHGCGKAADVNARCEICKAPYHASCLDGMRCCCHCSCLRVLSFSNWSVELGKYPLSNKRYIKISGRVNDQWTESSIIIARFSNQQARTSMNEMVYLESSTLDTDIAMNLGLPSVFVDAFRSGLVHTWRRLLREKSSPAIRGIISTGISSPLEIAKFVPTDDCPIINKTTLQTKMKLKRVCQHGWVHGSIDSIGTVKGKRAIKVSWGDQRVEILGLDIVQQLADSHYMHWPKQPSKKSDGWSKQENQRFETALKQCTTNGTALFAYIAENTGRSAEECVEKLKLRDDVHQKVTVSLKPSKPKTKKIQTIVCKADGPMRMKQVHGYLNAQVAQKPKTSFFAFSPRFKRKDAPALEVTEGRKNGEIAVRRSTMHMSRSRSPWRECRGTQKTPSTRRRGSPLLALDTNVQLEGLQDLGSVCSPRRYPMTPGSISIGHEDDDIFTDPVEPRALPVMKFIHNHRRRSGTQHLRRRRSYEGVAFDAPREAKNLWNTRPGDSDDESLSEAELY
eukprot:GEMP01005023.1.p1 GENE.GEMP01005023.1~~GEMP01005023.1.p1  ORF type:complete len:568 (+),score=77.01 GEMP01005023.1:82-1785(+)